MKIEVMQVLTGMILINVAFFFVDSKFLIYIATYLTYYVVLITLFLVSELSLEWFLLALISPPLTFILRNLQRHYRYLDILTCPQCKQEEAGVKVHKKFMGLFDKRIIGWSSRGFKNPVAKYAKLRLRFRCKFCGKEWKAFVTEQV